ncbi:hypothetical protein F441_08962 [Phytophthora nicotianae CJ01A1]|uniref:RxLR effector protein n=1 Tax=Phytophthora nicotianae CJ01A1 TaxID=1317063 RepID=W2X3C9_PHYNI|nr:hypothetical protein F441_08962 [Phytophthora nicotianae CJ01A1]
MRLSFIIFVLVSVCFAPSVNSNTTGQTTHGAGNRSLRGDETADVEERAQAIIGKWLWGPFSSATWKKMLVDTEYQRIMFKKWDGYSVDTIKERIGRAIIQDDNNLAKMMLDYVANHRVYK